VLLSNGPLGSALLKLRASIATRWRSAIVYHCTVSDERRWRAKPKEAFAAIPVCQQKTVVNPFVLIISDNDTKLSAALRKIPSAWSERCAMGALGWS